MPKAKRIVRICDIEDQKSVELIPRQGGGASFLISFTTPKEKNVWYVNVPEHFIYRALNGRVTPIRGPR